MPIVSFKQDEENSVEFEVLGCGEQDVLPGDNWLRVRVKGVTNGAVTEYVTDLQLVNLEEFLQDLVEGPAEVEEWEREICAHCDASILDTLESGIFLAVEESADEVSVDCELSPKGIHFEPHICFNLRVNGSVVVRAIRDISSTVSILRLSGRATPRRGGLMIEPNTN